jgi:NAD(P)-dependent dehydrogenase (short-subunit alcohol dehydrogenase family)
MENAIVTGSAKGIGLAISKALLKRKYFVVMNYANDTENAERVTSELSRDYSGQFAMIKQRLETEEDIMKFYEDTQKILIGGG